MHPSSPIATRPLGMASERVRWPRRLRSRSQTRFSALSRIAQVLSSTTSAFFSSPAGSSPAPISTAVTISLSAVFIWHP